MSKVAYVFPGQGSQEVGMLQDVATEVAPLFEQASNVLGYNLWELISDGPADQLNQTEYTQPALLSASVALFQYGQDRDLPAPDLVAGHSLGEYSALVAAGVISFVDAVALVQKRGQLMQSAVPVGEGGMAAVLGLDTEQVAEACLSASAEGDTVQAANINAPGQIVIAGMNGALDRAIDACKEAGAKRAMRLAVSAPFHSEMMKPAAEQMAEVLASVTFNKPSVPVVQNVNAEIVTDPDAIRNNLVSQMYSAVLWTDCVQKLIQEGVTTTIECGPGKVLTGLAKRIDRSVQGLNVGGADITAVKEALAS